MSNRRQAISSKGTKMKALELFERIVFSAKRLVLDYDLSDDEAKEIASATDKVNKIRGRYTDRKLEEISDLDHSEIDKV